MEHRLGGYRVETYPAAAAWVVEALAAADFDHTVADLIPPVYPAYARILHPASGNGDRDVTWSEIASANGKRPNKFMQWESITLSPDTVWIHDDTETLNAPETWALPPRQRLALLATLASFGEDLETPCYFLLWDGGRVDLPGDVERVAVPGRDSFLLSARLATALDGVGDFFDTRPDHWWPEDRSWFLAGDTDLPDTYVGGPEALIEQILANPALESYRVDSTQSHLYDADPFNTCWRP